MGAIGRRPRHRPGRLQARGGQADRARDRIGHRHADGRRRRPRLRRARRGGVVRRAAYDAPCDFDVSAEKPPLTLDARLRGPLSGRQAGAPRHVHHVRPVDVHEHALGPGRRGRENLSGPPQLRGPRRGDSVLRGRGRLRDQLRNERRLPRPGGPVAQLDLPLQQRRGRGVRSGRLRRAPTWRSRRFPATTLRWRRRSTVTVPRRARPPAPRCRARSRRPGSWTTANPGHKTIVLLVTDGEPGGCSSTIQSRRTDRLRWPRRSPHASPPSSSESAAR